MCHTSYDGPCKPFNYWLKTKPRKNKMLAQGHTANLCPRMRIHISGTKSEH